MPDSTSLHQLSATMTNLSRPQKQFKKLIIMRFISENVLVFLLQYIGLMFTTLNSPLSPAWLATGTACAFIFLRGYSVLVGIGLGTFFSYYFAQPYGIIAVSCALIFTAQTAGIYFLCQKWINPSLLFNRFNPWLKFIILSTLITIISSKLLVLSTYHLLPTLPPAQLVQSWWLANLNGILVFALPIIAWDGYFPDFANLNNKTPIPIVLSYTCLILATFGLALSGYLIFILAIIHLGLIIFISIKYQWCGHATAVFITGFLLCLIHYFIIPNNWDNLTFAHSIFIAALLCLESLIGFFLAIEFTKQK